MQKIDIIYLMILLGFSLDAIAKTKQTNRYFMKLILIVQFIIFKFVNRRHYAPPIHILSAIFQKRDHNIMRKLQYFLFINLTLSLLGLYVST